MKTKRKILSEDLCNDYQLKSLAVNWYKSLSFNQKIALKEVSSLICDMKWEEFNILFTPRERLEILHNKLIIEGFDI